MEDGCTAPVTHIDNKGYIYCERHGIERRDVRPCRKLLARELRLLRADQAIHWDSKLNVETTTTTPHTTGKWEFKGECEPLPNDGSSQFQIWQGNRVIAVVVSTEEESIGVSEGIANARLLAAAPDLLEACELALSRLKPAGSVKKDFSGHVAHAALSKAIARAKGGDA
jgi:hypothetical protein